jgi:hypothetical protein
VRKLVIDRLIDCGLPQEKLVAGDKLSIPRNALADLRMPSRTGNGPVVRSIRIVLPASNMFRLRDEYNVWVEPGANHHYAIYENDEGGRKGQIVTLFEAYRRQRLGKPVIENYRTDLGKFVCSLQRREMWLLDLTPETQEELDAIPKQLISRNLCYVQKITDKIITLNRHINTSEYRITRDNTKERLAVNKGPNTIFGTKVSISSTGQLSLDHS